MWQFKSKCAYFTLIILNIQNFGVSKVVEFFYEALFV